MLKTWKTRMFKSLLMTFVVFAVVLFAGNVRLAHASTGEKTNSLENQAVENSMKVSVKVELDNVNITVTDDTFKSDLITITIKSADESGYSYFGQGELVGGSYKFTTQLDPGIYMGTVHGIKSGEYVEIEQFYVVGKSVVKSVKLDKANLSMTINQTYKLNAKIEPSTAPIKDVIWTSDNDKIAVVDEEGVVTAVGAGKAKITVETVDGGKKAYCTVNVVPVSGISINKEGISVKVGQKYKLSAKVTPSNAVNRNITWSSTDSAIAYVTDSGNVIGVSAGTTTIKAVSQDGGFEDECTVTVTAVDKMVEVKEIQINKTELVLKVNQKSKLIAKIYGEKDGRKVAPTNKNLIWESSDERVIKVDENGNILSIAPGTAIITVKALENPEISASCLIKVIKPIIKVSLDSSRITVAEASSEEIIMNLTPADVTDPSITWKIDNEKVAIIDDENEFVIDENGNVTIMVRGLAKGKTKITFFISTEDGSKKIVSCYIEVN